MLIHSFKGAESQAIQMYFHIISIIFVLNFNTSYQFGCDWSDFWVRVHAFVHVRILYDCLEFLGDERWP